MSNLTFHQGLVSAEERARYVGQKGFTIWFTGLSASGKSTVACALEQTLLKNGVISHRLDGDNIRFGLNSNLGFSDEDRTENIRRISEVCKLFTDACIVVIASFISPFAEDRERARRLHEKSGLPFIEVFADASLDVVKQRDPKGLYKKAIAGEIKDFTGISSPYEAPENPDIHLNTGEATIEACVLQILRYLKQKNLLKAGTFLDI